MTKLTPTHILLASAIAWPSAIVAADHDPDGFHWMVAPYLLLASMDGEVTVGRATDVSVSVDTDDIFSHIDVGGMVHGEMWYQRWGLLGEWVGMRLTDSVASGKPYATGGVVADVEMTETVYEIIAARRFLLDHGVTIDALAGMRAWDVSSTVNLSGAYVESGISADESWIDPLVGARVIWPFADHWSMASRADIGGFGVGSDLSINASLDVGYQVASWCTLVGGYKALWVDYDNDKGGGAGTFVYNVITHGFRVGAAFGF
jgi:hypothetical protein